MKKHLLLILLFYFSGLFNPLLSKNNIRFQTYSKKEGHISNYTYCMFQDSKGFLWFGTKNGVSRFDGYEFKNYYGDNTTGTYSEGWTRTIICDKKDRLWFGCMSPEGKSLLLYDYENDIFIDYEPQLYSKNLNVISLLCDKDGNIWAGTLLNGIFCFHPDSMDVTHIILEKEVEMGLPAGCINSMMEDKFGDIWIGTSNGLYIYDNYAKKLKRYNNLCVGGNYNIDSPVECIYQDNESDIWIGLRDGGLIRHVLPDPENENTQGSFEIMMHDPENKSSLPNNTVYGIYRDSKNNLWVGTLSGLGIMDKTTKKFTTYHHIPQNTGSINSNLIRSVFRDNTGIMWLTTSMGIVKQRKLKFSSFNHSVKSNSISHNKVEMIYEDSKKNIWFGTPKGLDVLNIDKWQFKHVWHINSDFPACFNSNTDIFLVVDKHGAMYKYDCIKRYISLFAHKKSGDLIIEGNRQLKVLFDHEKNTWIGSSGLYCFDKDNITLDTFFHDKNNPTSLSNNNISFIFEDSNNEIWIGTNNGLNRLVNKQKGIFMHYFMPQNESSDNINTACIIEDRFNNIWIGVFGCIYCIAPDRKKYYEYGAENGIPSTNIRGILIDELNNLWLSSNSGLIKFTPNYQHLDSMGQIRIFREADGLNSDEFHPHSCAKTQDGALIFGGNGFTYFFPGNIKDNEHKPEIALTELYVFNKLVEIGDTLNKQVILNKALTETEQITLNHNNNDFSIKFAALHYAIPEKNQYAYMLMGYHNSWQYIDASVRKADFMNLESGEYTFQVKAANNDGIWNTKAASLNIIIKPPYWKTVWFRLLLFVLFSISIVSIIEMRIYLLKRQKRELEIKVKKRTFEVKKQKEEIERQRDNLELKNRTLEKQSSILKKQKEEITYQASQIKKMNTILEKHNLKLELDLKNISESRVMHKLITYDEYKKIFPDEGCCIIFLAEPKWEAGFKCKKCGSKLFCVVEEVLSRRCRKCNYVESVTAGTIFHKLRFPIEKALYILIVTSTGKNINISQLSNTINLRLKTCWSFNKKVLERMKMQKTYKNPKKGWVELIPNHKK